MAASLLTRRLGAPDRWVHLELSKIRVRPPLGHPRKTARTLILATHGDRWLCDILPERSARYVQLWVRKRIVPGAVVRHLDEGIFREIEKAGIISSPWPQGQKNAHPCRGRTMRLKRSLKTFHNAVDYEKVSLFLKEMEFDSHWRGAQFDQILSEIAFSPHHALI